MSRSRQEHRSATSAAIRAAARAEIAERGGGGLSMRAVAREVGLVSSAVYRYFPTREALLTEMIVESYGHLAAALGRATGTGGAPHWRALGRAFRDWARAAPHEFQLLYGTPVPGYVAPPETFPAAAAVTRAFLEVGAMKHVARYGGTELTEQVEPVAALVPGAERSGSAAVLAEVAALVGLVTLELSGHLAGSTDPADHLLDALLERQVATLRLSP